MSPGHRGRHRGSGSSSAKASLREDELVMYDLILRTLEYEPSRRVSLREAMRHNYFDRLVRGENIFKKCFLFIFWEKVK